MHPYSRSDAARLRSLLLLGGDACKVVTVSELSEAEHTAPQREAARLAPLGPKKNFCAGGDPRLEHVTTRFKSRRSVSRVLLPLHYRHSPD